MWDTESKVMKEGRNVAHYELKDGKKEGNTLRRGRKEMKN